MLLTGMRNLKQKISDFLEGTDRRLVIAAMLLAWLTAYKYIGLL